jgi:hypothetical protein
MKEELACKLVPDTRRGPGYYKIYIPEELVALGPARVIVALNLVLQKLRADFLGEKFMSEGTKEATLRQRHREDVATLVEHFRSRVRDDDSTLRELESIVSGFEPNGPKTPG